MTDALSPDTPYLAVDVAVLERNLERAATDARERGIALRPHAKTHKVPEIARRQQELGAVGLTVATVSEAEVFAAAGLTDLFIAYPVWPSAQRVSRLRTLAARASLRLGVDSVESVRALGAALSGTSVELMVEIDSGHHRSGVAPADSVAIAEAIVGTGLRCGGVFTFPGHGYAPDARFQAARDEASAIAEAAAAIERAGTKVPVRSGGSTPTRAESDPSVITEMRPGVYVFNDAQQAELGSCSWHDIALTARTTVVSRSADTVILDAGSKILGADRPSWTTGFGRLPDFPDARVVALSEHHATVQFPAGQFPAGQFAAGEPIPQRGSVLRVAPNHVCSAVNLVDELYVEHDGSLVESWAVAARGANS